MSANNHIIRRIGLVYWFVVLLGIGVVVQTIRLQFNQELRGAGQEASYKEAILLAVRGSILAEDGRLLALSLPFYELRMDCTVAPDSVFTKYVGTLSAELAKFFKDKSADQYKNNLISERKKANKYYKINTRWIDYTELQQVKKFPIFKIGQNKGGLIAEQKSRRKYPYERLASRTIGREETDWQIPVGIEAAFDYCLRGIPGKRMEQRLPGGDWMPVNSDVDLAPHDGMDVVATIDVDIQDAAETALRGLLAKDPLFEGGTAIVMEVATGEIRAIANMQRQSNNTYDETYNYAIGWATEPGSTFKLATLISLLEDNYVTLDTPIETGDGTWTYYNKTFRDSHKGSGTVSMLRVFEESSNVGFAKTAVQFYKTNERRFVDRLYTYNLNKPLGLQISGEATPLMNYPGDKLWSGLSLPMMAHGYEVTLTPMHTLTFYNAVANNGRMVKPKFVKTIQTKRGTIQKEFKTEVINSSICSPTVLKTVRSALRSVVENGTAKAINDSRYSISGKTGTSRLAFKVGDKLVYQNGNYKKHQASFVGFFPSEEPRYSVIVVLYSELTQGNFYGGTWAAPVFKQIADKLYVANSNWESNTLAKNDKPQEMPSVKGGKKTEVDKVLSELNISSKRVLKDVQWVDVLKNGEYVEEVPKNTSTQALPSVLNMGLKDALFLLENMDLQVSFSGKGRVLKQTPEAGSQMNKGQQIYLELGI